jgi:hypothetical protein
MRNLVERIEKLWCENMHDSVMWPIHGRYRCSKCLREYAVEFEELQHQSREIVWGAIEPARAVTR